MHGRHAAVIISEMREIAVLTGRKRIAGDL
jgi:hypothetical protein